MADRISEESADRSDNILRKLHNLPGQVDEAPSGKNSLAPS
jgi:hypothetical protein